MCDLEKPLHIQWTKSDASYTESAMVCPQRISRKGFAGNPGLVPASFQGAQAHDESKHTYSLCLWVCHQADLRLVDPG